MSDSQTSSYRTPYRASSFVSNTFNFVFRFEDTVSLRRVLPSTHEEAVTLVCKHLYHLGIKSRVHGTLRVLQCSTVLSCNNGGV
jgi:hypothetical protein